MLLLKFLVNGIFLFFFFLSFIDSFDIFDFFPININKTIFSLLIKLDNLVKN